MRATPLFFAASILAMSSAQGQPHQDDDEPTQEPTVSTKLGTHENRVDRMVFFQTASDWKAGELTRIAIAGEGDGAHLVLADDRERGFPRRGRFETAEIEGKFPFTEVLPSWNPITPPETGISFEIRTLDAESGEWSPWLYVGRWGRTPIHPDRTIEFENGAIHIDYLRLTKPATKFQLRADFVSYDPANQANPELHLLAINYSGYIQDEALRGELYKHDQVALEENWAKHLEVPFLAQGELDRTISGSTCSPTSVSMVMGYRGIERDYRQNALDIYDDEYSLFGNWARATSLPGTFGLPSYLTRFRNWDQVKAMIANDQPIIASIRYREGEFPSNPLRRTNGHLIVIVGFTPEGDVIVNDPAHTEVGSGIVYKADELAAAWLDKGGVGYIITAAR